VQPGGCPGTSACSSRGHGRSDRAALRQKDEEKVLVKSTVEVQLSPEAVLGARIEQLEAALAEALDIAEWESSEYRGKRSHPARLLQLRQVLTAKVTGP